MSGEQQYLDLLKHVLENGEQREDRTGTGTISVFAPRDLVFDLSKGFPILTTKKMGYKTVFKELQWFLSGSTNVKDLIKMNCNIWNEDAFRWFKTRISKAGVDLNKNFTVDDYVQTIKQNERFADVYGDLGPIYGKQWRDFGGVDQLEVLIETIKKDPFNRRLIISGWNPAQQLEMALPPCHVLYHFYVTNDKKLHLKMYQRSGDLFLGVPFNIASACALLSIVAKECELTPGIYTHSLGDAHIYNNHIEAVKTQLERTPYELSTIEIKDTMSVFDFKYDDIIVKDYESHEKITADVSVG